MVVLTAQEAVYVPGRGGSQGRLADDQHQAGGAGLTFGDGSILE